MESGATAWEVREMIRRIRDDGPVGLCADSLTDRISDFLNDLKILNCLDHASDIVNNAPIGDHYTNAMLIEALECLAEKKEGARVHG